MIFLSGGRAEAARTGETTRCARKDKPPASIPETRSEPFSARTRRKRLLLPRPDRLFRAEHPGEHVARNRRSRSRREAGSVLRMHAVMQRPHTAAEAWGPHGGKGQCPAQGGEESDDGGAGSNTTTSRAQRRETSELRPEADQRPALASERRRADNRGRSRRGHSAIFGVMRTGRRERAAPVPSAKTGKRTFPVRHTKKAPRCEHRGAEGSSQTSNAEDAGHAAWLR